MGEGLVDARCIVHPEEVAAGTCSRCGSFLCSPCTTSGVCTRCQARLAPKARGFGGWLVVPIITLALLPLQFIVLGFRFVNEVNKIGGFSFATENDARWLWVSLFGVATCAIVTVWIAFLAPDFIAKRRVSIRRMRVLYLLVFGSNVMIFIIGFRTQGAITTIGQILVPLIWIGYFGASKRVKETFVR